MSGPATVSGNTLTVRNIATGAMGCIGEVSDQQLWVLEFLKRPIEQTFSQGTLTWKSGTDTLNFKTK
jgi:heat shock protein HslJ